MGAGAAACRTGLCHGLYLHRPAAVRRAGSERFARKFRLAGGGVLVSRCANAGRRNRHVHFRSVSLRLSARPHRLHGASERHAGSRTFAGPGGMGEFFPHFTASGTTGRGGGNGTGPDGDACRLRHGGVFRSSDLHDRHLPRLVLAGRPCRRRAAFRRVAWVCRAGTPARARQSRSRTLSQHHRTQPTASRTPLVGDQGVRSSPGLRRAVAAGFSRAFWNPSAHGACRGRCPVRCALCAVGRQQLHVGGADRTARGGICRIAGLCRTLVAVALAAVDEPHRRAGLFRAGLGDRRRRPDSGNAPGQLAGRLDCLLVGRQSRTADNGRHRRAGLCLSDTLSGDSAADSRGKPRKGHVEHG